MRAVVRFIKWQIQSRLVDHVQFDWIDGTRLIVERGMTGATGNIYCGLHEYEDMSFILHALRPDDLFVDVGANIGSYTILASGVCGSDSVSIEPDPETAGRLRRNVQANHLESNVTVVETAVGAEIGTISFTVGKDTTNQVADETDVDVRTVALATLDHVLRGMAPTIIKMDVEGFETEALKGAVQTLEKSSLLAIETETVDAAALAILNRAGFRQYRYNPQTRSLVETSTATSSNSLFLRDVQNVRERLISAPRRLYRGIEV